MRGRSDIRKLIALDEWILNNDTVAVYNDSDIRFLLDWQFGRLGGFNDNHYLLECWECTVHTMQIRL